MDWEAPVDAWYVYLGVSVVSVAVAGVALGLPSGPPPDANQAANTIDTVAASSTDASGRWNHDAETVVVEGPTLELSNDHGTSRSSLEYGVVVPVADSDRLEALTRGADFEDEYDAAFDDGDAHAVDALLSDLETEYANTSGTTLTASGDLAVRQLRVDPDEDELTNRHESADIAVTKTSRFDNVRAVTLSYDGVDDRTVTLTLEGQYTTGSDLEYTETQTFDDGDGELAITDISSPTVGNAGEPPLEYVLEYEDGAQQGSVDVDRTASWHNEIERSATVDDDAPYVDYDEETGEYHVTLVTV